MTGILTGDIINSRSLKDQNIWMKPLKKLLSDYGEAPARWEIYRGDSFQLQTKSPEDSLMAAIMIRSCIKSIETLDVRIGIGIGARSYRSAKISESNGEAYINSGEVFESLKKNRQNLAFRSPWKTLDRELNLLLLLTDVLMEGWTNISAEMVLASIKNKELSQEELGAKLKRTQSSISERQKRAHLREIMEVETYYRDRIHQHIHQQ